MSAISKELSFFRRVKIVEVSRVTSLSTGTAQSQARQSFSRVKPVRKNPQTSLRTAEFEGRARRMEITGEALVAEKVAIWEGMYAAGQHGDGTEVSVLVPLNFRGYSENVANCR